VVSAVQPFIRGPGTATEQTADDPDGRGCSYKLVSAAFIRVIRGIRGPAVYPWSGNGKGEGFTAENAEDAEKKRRQTWLRIGV